MIFGQAIERYLNNGNLRVSGGCDMVSVEQAIAWSRDRAATCIEHDTSAMGGGVTYYYQGKEIRPPFLSAWAAEARRAASEPWVADGETISVNRSRDGRGKVAVTIGGTAVSYSLDQIDHACSHRDPLVAATWREIARRARVLLCG